jgi:hypothetical protein
MFSASLRRTIVAGRRATAPSQRRFLASDMPVPQSQHAPMWGGHTVAKEGWEETIYFYFAAATVLQALIIFGAPETSIESWARPEAQARLLLAAQNGDFEPEFGKHYQDVVKESHAEIWTKYANRATIPGDDDDDDEDDDDDDDDDDEVRK